MKHRIVTAAQMKEIERAGNARGLPYLQMMENAGLAAYTQLRARLPQGGALLIVCGKGNKQRLVPISANALHELQLWLYDRNLMNIKPGEDEYVFLNRRGAHLTRTMILIMIKNTARDAGITKTVSPHTLRHSFATALLQGGANLRAIQEMLGHENISTTQIYTHIDITTLRDEILNHHPRNMRKASEDDQK